MTGFVVYRQAYEDGRPFTDQFEDDHGTRVALCAFADRPAADAHVAELMRAAYRRANPFAALCHGVAPASVAALGVPFRELPQDDWDRWDYELWEVWYDNEAPHLTDADRAKVWSLFDARPLYGVAEVPLGDA